MPDYKVIKQHALATAPAFFGQVERAFAFLTTSFGYSLESHDIMAADDVRDMQLTVTYRGEHLAVEVSWDVVSVSLGVFFTTLPTATQGVNSEGAVRPRVNRISLDDLAAVRGHADDPDLLQGDLYAVSGRIINKRFTFIQAHLNDIVEGLARATEHYASDILHGDIGIFPEVQAYYDMRMETRLL